MMWRALKALKCLSHSADDAVMTNIRLAVSDSRKFINMLTPPLQRAEINWSDDRRARFFLVSSNLVADSVLQWCSYRCLSHSTKQYSGMDCEQLLAEWAECVLAGNDKPPAATSEFAAKSTVSITDPALQKQWLAYIVKT